MYCEEFINCLPHLLSIAATTGDDHKVPCPELTGIFQSSPNVELPMSEEIFNFTENSMVIQVTDIPLQPFLHQIEA